MSDTTPMRLYAFDNGEDYEEHRIEFFQVPASVPPAEVEAFVLAMWRRGWMPVWGPGRGHLMFHVLQSAITMGTQAPMTGEPIGYPLGMEWTRYQVRLAVEDAADADDGEERVERLRATFTKAIVSELERHWGDTGPFP